MQVHASCAARGGDGVLLLGPPGAGKSDMVLRLLHHGFVLVADDRVEIEGDRARPANGLAGLLEVRGLGILRLPHLPSARLRLAVSLGPVAARLPEPARHAAPGLALDLPLVTVDPARPSAAQVVALALDCALGRVAQLAGGVRVSERAPNGRQPVVLVSGLSGAGKASILRTLEDLGFEAIDNPPLTLIEDLVARAECGAVPKLAVGVDARTRGFDADAVLATLARLRQNPALRPELVFAWADETMLLRRFTETRRRHPLAPNGRVSEGIVAEQALTAPLQEAADLVVDTTDLPLPALRRLIERRYGPDGSPQEFGGLSVSLLSFAFPAGLPRDADMVFDARFLRNPHYVSALKPRTGLDPEVGAYVAADPDYPAFFAKLVDLLSLLLPRFVQEGKKYVTIAIGCTGGRHRSVHIVETLASRLTETGWRVTTTHRELAREGTLAPSAPAPTTPPRTGAGGAVGIRSAQAQEA